MMSHLFKIYTVCKLRGLTLNCSWKETMLKLSPLLKGETSKDSDSPAVIGAVGLGRSLYLGKQHMKSGTIPLLSLPYPSLIRKKNK